MKKNYLYGIAAAAVFCALAFGLWRVWQSSLPETAEGEKTVTVEVTHGDGSTAEFTYQTDLEYLGELLAQEGLISGTPGDGGLRQGPELVAPDPKRPGRHHRRRRRGPPRR